MAFEKRLISTLMMGLVWLLPAVSHGQNVSNQTNTIVVFDGSGSMWGQIQGKSKIEIARETLSSVLSETPFENRLGMIAYGHRQKGVCSDIEIVVPVQPASQSIPKMIDVAKGMNPKGKTPLTDAVRIAAEELKYTENAATVILMTDGIETCEADPCALATELENAGIGFTAHVIGFGLSQEEGRQVQCLADNTGGLYLSAQNADELSDALRQTVEPQPIAFDEDDFGDEIQPARNVRFIFRDTDQGEQIGIRQLSGYLENEDGSSVENSDFAFAYPEANGNSATAVLQPGTYIAALTRSMKGAQDQAIRYRFNVPEGAGDHLVEAALSGSLKLNIFINPKMQWRLGDDFPTAVGRSRPRFNFEIWPIDNDTVPSVSAASISNIEEPIPLSPGRYLIRGNIDSGTSVERVVEVQAGSQTEFDFSFDATRVFINAQEANGQPVQRQTTYWYDKIPSGRNYWVSGGGRSDGQLVPFYLPTGTWITNVGGEGYGKRRSEIAVEVPGDFSDIFIDVGEGKTLDEDDKGYFSSPAYAGCLDIVKVAYSGCLIARADLTSKHDPSPSDRESKENTDVDHPERNLEGLTGTAHVFVDADLEPKAFVVFENGDATGDATIIIKDGWCGASDCPGQTLRERAKYWKLLLEDGFSAAGLNANSIKLDVASFGQDKELSISEGKYSRIRLTFFEQIELTRNSEPDTPSQSSQSSDKVVLVFADFDQNPLVDIIFSDGIDDVTITLEDGWCGREGCGADTIAVEKRKVSKLAENGYVSSTFGAGRYRIEFSTFGEAKTLWITEGSNQRVRFDMLEQIGAGSNTPADQVANEAQPEQLAPKLANLDENLSIEDKVNRIFGIFQMDQSGLSIDEITSDFLHQQSCQRSPIVIYADHSIAYKSFTAPKSPNDNPYKTTAVGQCDVSGSQYTCKIRDDIADKSETISFKSTFIGNNHFELAMTDGKRALAASCFFPGGALQAGQLMPNGRALGDLIAERNDGGRVVMSYDKNNNIYKDMLK